jgi:hypothetical protein
VALTEAYTQWYGDHVGMFGHSNLEKDPKVWSYGIEYTPVPLISGFLNQRQTERGRTDTEFGLNFTYHFGMPFEDQIRHSKVAELRIVSDSQHEFVDRENRIILEYRAKNAYRIEYLGSAGPNFFRFRILNSFDEFMAGQTVHVTASGAYLAEAAPAQPATFFAQALQWLDEVISVKAAWAADRSKIYVTDGRGEFVIELTGVSGPTPVTVRAGNNEQTFTSNGNSAPLNGLIVKFTPPAQTDFTTAASGYQSTVGMEVKRMVNGVETALTSSDTVTWAVTSNISGLSTGTNGVWKRAANAKNGLTWGTAADTASYSNGNSSWGTDAIAGTAPSGSGTATHTASLTDVVGSRTITVTVTVGGETSSGDSFTFGQGPLSAFSKTGANGSGGGIRWSDSSANDTSYGFQSAGNTFPAAAFCGGSVNRDVTVTGNSGPSSAGFDPGASGGWSAAYMPPGITAYLERYAENSKLPKAEQLLPVAAYNASYTAVPERKGAALAAGWSFGNYNYAWTGGVDIDGSGFSAVSVGLDDGDVGWGNVDNGDPAAVCLP